MSNLDSNYANPYASFGDVVAAAPANERATFIRKTYIHLAAAIYAFAAVAYAIFKLANVDALMGQFFAIPYAHFMMLGAFMLVSWVANSWAHSNVSRGKQYAGLSLYVVAEAIFFVPLFVVCPTACRADQYHRHRRSDHSGHLWRADWHCVYDGG